MKGLTHGGKGSAARDVDSKAYGKNFDEFEPTASSRSDHDGSRRWIFQFTIGQGFNQ